MTSTGSSSAPSVSAPAVGDLVQALEGVKPGARVVTESSFLLGAEAARTRSGG